MFFIAHKDGEFGFGNFIIGALDDKVQILIWYRVFGMKGMLKKSKILLDTGSTGGGNPYR